MKQFEYVKIANKGLEDCINLFFNNQIIAFISDVELAKQIKLTIPEMKKLYEN